MSNVKVWEMIGVTRSVTRGKTSVEMGWTDSNWKFYGIIIIYDDGWRRNENLTECVEIPGRG